ncbi:hypothetical protein MUO32_12175 [Shinella sp. CPCC 101442]|uniref:hypothetical protein n=1 Tax=Shinella sp. CPCC 101442 TaxID=2932265 RepID=UPI002152DFC7|nr:hypothetical protein [Shinella sp. CPCC 101442]MCR6499797.1 hypothetical protein [Shinella sp. CPCC 101442]
MDILTKLRTLLARYRQKRLEREALRLLIARGDRRLLRDAGLSLAEGDHPRVEPLPRTKERRWTAPLIRLPRPSLHKHVGRDVAPASESSRPAA